MNELETPINELDSPIDEMPMEELEEGCKLEELNIKLEDTSRLDEDVEADSCAEVPVSVHPKVIITRPNSRNPLMKRSIPTDAFSLLLIFAFFIMINVNSLI